MKLIIKHFNELTLNELVDIYKLRVSIFVVEQKCPCQEIDDADKVAFIYGLRMKKVLKHMLEFFLRVLHLKKHLLVELLLKKEDAA